LRRDNPEQSLVRVEHSRSTSITEEIAMKKILFAIGLTGVLALVNAGTRADAAQINNKDGGDGPSLTCEQICGQVCHQIGCECEGCIEGAPKCGMCS
jgi:hypothetical protein